MNDDSLVVDFHLGGTALNDEGLAQIKALPKVVQLDLKDTQITDAGLANLATSRRSIACTSKRRRSPTPAWPPEGPGQPRNT